MKNIVYPEKENMEKTNPVEFNTHSIPQFEPVPMKKYNAISADDETTKDNEKSFFGPLEIKPNPVKKDMVNHPPHYNVGGFEVIDIIKTFTEGLDGIKAVDTANAIKYILRWPRKNGVEDLKKAKWYIEHLIKEMEDDSNKR